MTAIRADAQQPASAGAAYVVDASIVDVVHVYLTQSGLEVQAVKVSPEQLPRFNVLPAGIRISHLERARRAKLSDREFEALTLIAEGLSNPEIAERQNVALARHNAGRAALKLLAQHGGPNLLERLDLNTQGKDHP